MSSGVASRHLLPDALRIEEAELCGTSNGNSAVVENLAGEVIPDAARVAVFGAADRCLDVAVVVWYLDTEATVLGHVVDPHLCCNTKQKPPFSLGAPVFSFIGLPTACSPRNITFTSGSPASGHSHLAVYSPFTTTSSLAHAAHPRVSNNDGHRKLQQERRESPWQ